MPPKARQVKSQVKAQQAGMMQAMSQLEQRSDEELEREQRHRAAAQAILGSRAAERYDAAAAREHFRKAVAASRPQERMAIRRMADASLAFAERRPDDLKAAVERLGQEAPSAGQLRMLRLLGFIAPGKTAPFWKRARGVVSVIVFVIVLLAVAALLVMLVSWPLGGPVSTLNAFWIGVLVVIAALGVLTLLGRRRQRAAQAKRAGPS
ncbi:MAG: hypothetical protein V9E83_06310 [Baekduia sp.]